MFEVGPVYLPKDGQVLPEEPVRLSLLLAGPRSPQGWQPADREAMSTKVIQAWRSSPDLVEPLRPATLVKAERELEQESVSRILLQRDNKSMDLQE